MTDHDCLGGWVAVEPPKNTDFTDAERPRQHRLILRRCRLCLLNTLAAQCGRSNATWETWQPIPALESSVQVLRSWTREPWSMLLHAAPSKPNFGAGKTHAALAYAAAHISSGHEALYWFLPDFIELSRRAIADSSITPPNLGDYPHLLVLDDVGAEARTEWTCELVDRLLDRRYRRRLPTLLATNLDLASLEARYPRAISRLCEGVRIAWHAPDYRRRNQ